jgi:hypothetical protein
VDRSVDDEHRPDCVAKQLGILLGMDSLGLGGCLLTFAYESNSLANGSIKLIVAVHRAACSQLQHSRQIRKASAV